MNDLEERLRAALDARAATFEAGPTAWMKVQQRAGRRRWAWPVLLAALPVALVALLVPVLLNGGQDGQVTMGPPPKPAPVGEALVIDNPAEDRPMRLWYANDEGGLVVLCLTVQYAGGSSQSSCGDNAGAQAMKDYGWFEGTTQSVPPRETVLDYGGARKDVAKVTAVTKKGSRVVGAVHQPSGAPMTMKIWTVVYPATDQVTAYEFAAADGTLLSRVARSVDMPTESERGKPAGAATDLADLSVRPYSTPDRTLIWTFDGRELGMNLVRAKDLMRDMGGQPMDVELRVNGEHWFGVARQDTARMELIRKDGTVLKGVVKPDPWKIGVRLFAGERPFSGDLYLEGFTLVGYDSSGKQLWRDDHPADKPQWDPHPPIGEVVTIGEAKVWFSKVTLADGRTWDGLCRSVAGEKTTCDAFQPVAAGDAKRLPDLGKSAIGVAGSEVTQVEAVKSGTRGSVYAPSGAPLKIWVVPNRGGSERFALQNAEQDTVATVGGSAPDKCSVSPPVGQAAALGTGATLTHQDGCLIIWTDNGRFITEKHKIDDATYEFRSDFLAGYAVVKTAKVELIYDDGSRVTATLTADPWGLGLTLFSARSTKSNLDASVVGYDAAGKEIWRR
ncbi:hypothetical protein AB0B45_33980 [Nonomuraea sp. NPDC049152]|uniref:hypothetical protein n=1 Tax=Nonomuraea sp. NPDC049152 TaxID=3154350 RepID=UPI00340E98CB